MRTDKDCGVVGGLLGLIFGLLVAASIVAMVRYEYQSRAAPNDKLIAEWPPALVVRLKSGGPTMIVESVDDGKVRCGYFDAAGDYRNVYLSPELLSKDD